MSIRVAIVGYGNIGKYALESILAEPDMELAGIIRRKVGGSLPEELQYIPVVTDVTELGHVDVALLCVPTRSVAEEAPKYLKQGISTVDSFDIHGEAMWELKTALAKVGKEYNSAAIISAGWDPGSDSLIRGIMSLMVPRGITYTNFGPGMSMGHSVVAKSIAGVEDAVSLTIPLGTSLHRRLVYVKLKPGASLEQVSEAIKKDNYFSKNETHVYAVEDLENFKDMGHGVLMEHKGKAGFSHNQLLSYSHRINNPAVTSQVMVSSARAILKQKPGCYTMLEIPICDYLALDIQQVVTTMV